MIEKIKETVKKLFDENKIDIFIGYGQGTLSLRSTPCFITGQDGVEKLIWDSSCLNNLAVYLPRFFTVQPQKKAVKLPRVGILIKGCDGRSIVGLLKEHQVPRENLCIVGIPCNRMIDIKRAQLQFDGKEIVEAREEGEEIILTDEEKKSRKFKRTELVAEACLSCQYLTPTVYDILISEEKPEGEKTAGEDKTKEFEKKSIVERWQYFESEISKCIRCYACRQACPNCYCKECFADQTKPRWAGITNNISDIMFYHLGRIFHQAGRCVDCGACVRACPMGIDLRVFTHKLAKDVEELFGYQAGISLEEIPPLATFKPDDPQEFITEPLP